MEKTFGVPVSKSKKRRARRIRRALISLLILAALAATVVTALWDGLSVSKFSVAIEQLPSEFFGYRIALIADLHCARFGESQKELIAEIQALQPDIIVIAGDMIDQTLCDPEPTRELCSAFSNQIPMYAVLGNHDLWGDKSDLRTLLEIYETYNVTVLRNDCAEITRNGQTIYLYGADDPAYWGSDTVGFLTEQPLALSPVSDAVNLLLYHRANAFPALSSSGFDLILASHMHGGQVRIPFLGGLISPTRDYFPDYTAGHYEENGTQMIVSRGLGNSVSVPRIFNAPELVLITLECDN